MSLLEHFFGGGTRRIATRSCSRWKQTARCANARAIEWARSIGSREGMGQIVDSLPRRANWSIPHVKILDAPRFEGSGA